MMQTGQKLLIGISIVVGVILCIISIIIGIRHQKS